MTCVSSDTNIWFDFNTIGRIELPFLLPYTYVMYHEAIEEEIVDPRVGGPRCWGWDCIPSI